MRFRSEEEEATFAQYLKPEVALWTTLFHCASLFVQVLASVWIILVQVTSVDRPLTWEQGDPRRTGIILLIGFFLAQSLSCAVMVVVRRSPLSMRLPWEAASVAHMVVVCIVYPWINPWHAMVLSGVAPEQVGLHGGRCIEEAEGVAVIIVATLATGFCACVPIRLVWWPMIPVCALTSYALLLAIVGSSDPDMVPFHIGLLVLLLSLPAGSLRRREVRERLLWKRGDFVVPNQVISFGGPPLPQHEQPNTGRRRSSQACDITFYLSPTLELKHTSQAVHAMFFGRWAEGLLFTSFLQPQDRPRFEEMVAEITRSKRPGSMTCTVTLPHGPVRVALSAVDVGEVDDDPGEDARFIVGLEILDDIPRQLPVAAEGHRASSPPADGSRWAHVLSVPEHQELAQAGRSSSARVATEPLEFSPVLPRNNAGSGTISIEVHQSRSESSQSSPVASQVQPPAPSEVSVGSGNTLRPPLPQMPAFLNLVPSDCSGPSHRSSEDSIFFLSEATSRASGRRGRPSVVTHAVDTQTEKTESAEIAVNTDVVMHDFTFRCSVCSKPPAAPRLYQEDVCAPVIPGPEAQALIVKLDRKKGVTRSVSSSSSSSDSRQSSGTLRYCKHPDFNGNWVATDTGGIELNDWLCRFCIFNGHVVLGDGSEAPLLQVGSTGPVVLCGGTVFLREDGRLIRKGKSGKVVEFSLVSAYDTDEEVDFDEDEGDRLSYLSERPKTSGDE